MEENKENTEVTGTEEVEETNEPSKKTGFLNIDCSMTAKELILVILMCVGTTLFLVWLHSAMTISRPEGYAPPAFTIELCEELLDASPECSAEDRQLIAYDIENGLYTINYRSKKNWGVYADVMFEVLDKTCRQCGQEVPDSELCFIEVSCHCDPSMTIRGSNVGDWRIVGYERVHYGRDEA